MWKIQAFYMVSWPGVACPFKLENVWEHGLTCVLKKFEFFFVKI